MPDYEITEFSSPPGTWSVEIKDAVPSNTELEFTITDANNDTVTVTFTCT